LAEEFVVYLVGRVLDRCGEELKAVERDTAALERVQGPFPRITYTEAIERLNAKGNPIAWGDDFGADEETLLAADFDRPLMVRRFPASFKAFYMQPDPADPKVLLGLDMLAPEGYGEIIGGSQRIDDHDLLLARIRDPAPPAEARQWSLAVRTHGSRRHGPRAVRRLDVPARPPARDDPVPAHALQDLPLSLRSRIVAVFVLLSLVWGTTWAAIRVAVGGIPPLGGVALRFLVAGGALWL